MSKCEKDRTFIFLVLPLTLVHIFGPKKEKVCCLVLVLVNSKYNATFDLALYLLYEKLNISLTCDATTPFQYLKRIIAMQDSTLSEGENQFFFQR